MTPLRKKRLTRTVTVTLFGTALLVNAALIPMTSPASADISLANEHAAATAVAAKVDRAAALERASRSDLSRADRFTEFQRIAEEKRQAKLAAEAAKKKAAAEKAAAAKKAAAVKKSSSSTSSTPAGGTRALGKKMMLAAGFGESQWPCLEKLWTKESGWSATAHNSSSGAHGIPQALPGSKMGPGWQSDPVVQISWGLKYIKGRYGSPCGAWNAFLSKGWY